MTRFTLGQPVTFTDTVRKENLDTAVVYVSAGLPGIDYTWGKRTPVSEGIIVGSRTLMEYELNTEHEADGWGRVARYTECRPVPGSARRAWLVSFHLRRKPVLVLDEHVEARPAAGE